MAQVRDYLNSRSFAPGGSPKPLDAPAGDLVILDFEAEDNYAAIRPSGTEPKVKIYLFAYDPPSAGADLEATKAAQVERIKAIGAEFRAFSGSVIARSPCAGSAAAYSSPRL